MPRNQFERMMFALMTVIVTVMHHERIITQHLQHTQLQVLFFVRLSKDLRNDCAKWLSQFSISRGQNNKSVFQVLVRNAH